MTQRKYDEKRKKSNKKYMDSLTRATIWLTPDEKAILKERADKENKSLNCYLRNLLGFKDTPLSPAETFYDMTKDPELIHEKLKIYCEKKGYTYINQRYDLSLYNDPKDSSKNTIYGSIWVKDKDGNEIPLPLSSSEILKIQGIEVTDKNIKQWN